MNYLNEIENKIYSLGFVPSTRAMSDELAKDGIVVSYTTVLSCYKMLVSTGVVRETGISPAYVLNYCPKCGDIL